jgi:hypothetical protein
MSMMGWGVMHLEIGDGGGEFDRSWKERMQVD